MNPLPSSSTSQIEPIGEEEQPRAEEEEMCSNGESYQCGFCRRGFTNAQALGGHMNIHRRDRARMSTSGNSSTSSSSTNKHPMVNVVLPSSTISYYRPKENNHGYLRPNSIFLQGEDIKAPRHYYDYPMYFSPSSSSNCTRPMQSNILRPQQQQLQQQPLSLFEGEERYTNLQLGIGGNTSTAYIEEAKSQVDGEQEGGIDLELRLGHDN